MDLCTALKSIGDTNSKPLSDAIMCMRENKEAAIPLLIDFVANTIETQKNAQEWEEGMDDLVPALLLLAEFGASEAFHLYAEILELEESKCDWLLGDVLCGEMGGMTASVATAHDIERLKSIAINKDVNDYHRLAAVNALVGLYARGIYQRNDLVEFLACRVENYKDEDEFVDFLVDNCYDIAATELYGRIRQLIADGDVLVMFGDENKFNDESPSSEDRVIESLQERVEYATISDALAVIDKWNSSNVSDNDSYFNILDENSSLPWLPSDMKPINSTTVVNPPKTGRNAPCPCGSGQKYKRCCLTG